VGRTTVDRDRRRPLLHGTLGLALIFLGISPAMTATAADAGSSDEPPTVRLMTLDPGHFHAALVQKEMYPGVSDEVHVYAPLGPDLIAHLNRISLFNARPTLPTRWRLEVHAGPEPLERMLRSRPGNVVVLSGRNRGKIDAILASVRAGLNVLADKPWIIDSRDFPQLEEALDVAESKGVVAYDIMTERYEVTSSLQRALVADAAVTGRVLDGTESEPAVLMESVHHVMKTVAGVPNLRPAWFFDTTEQGEALADVGTHLVDLVPWMLFPGEPIDRVRDIRMLGARRWPTVLTKEEFARVTGDAAFPPFLASHVHDDGLHFQANTEVSYVLRGIHVRLRALWSYEAPAGGGDTHNAVVRGDRSRVEVRQGRAQGYRAEVYVVPNTPDLRAPVAAAVRARLSAVAGDLPGVSVEDEDGALHLEVPTALRTDHESHFGDVTRQFLEYLKNPGSIPRAEKTNMLAKYHVTTAGTDLSRQTKP
jgi:predicted dehydrogenase